ncbi:ABC transporter substrate-binding protein [Microbacterium pullorum]|nr:sugar ABC transporter substrate-binding protein [Microbacterium pullorum]
MRARSAALAVTVGGALALTGCGASGSGGDGDLIWSMWIGSTEDQQAWDAVAAAGAEAAGVDVTLQGAPFADYWTKLSTQLGTSSAPCIVSMQSLRLNQFTDGLLPLNDLIADSDIDIDAFDEGALEAMAFDGQQYALPYDTGPLVYFYNKDAYADAGVAEPEPGWTVDDFEAAAEQLAANDQIAHASSVEDLYLEASALAYNGASIISEDGEIAVDDPDFASAVEWLASLVEQGYATRADGADSTADDNAFANGTAAGMVAGPWQVLDVNAKTDFELGITTIPAGPGGGPTFSAGSGFGISSTCADPEAALEAIGAMTSPDVLSTLASDGRAFPARTAEQQLWYDNARVDGVDVAMSAALESAIPLPGSAQGDQLNLLLAQYGAQMLNGDQPAVEVLATMSDQLG